MLLIAANETVEAPNVPAVAPVGKQTIRFDARPEAAPNGKIPKHAFARTMLGLTPPAPKAPVDLANPADGSTVPSAAEPLAIRKPVPSKQHQTMLGISPFASPSGRDSRDALPPVGAEPTDLYAPVPNAKHQTMLGMVPFAPKEIARSLADHSPLDPTEPSDVYAPVPNDKNQTMMGMAPLTPSSDTTNQSASNRAEQTLLGAGTFAASDPGAFVPKDAKKGTLIGVAVPGIAPINPGVAKPKPRVEKFDTQDDAEWDIDPQQSNVDTPLPPTKTGTGRALLVVLTAVATLLALISILAIWWWRTSPKLSVEVQSDEIGNDSLTIKCSNCDDESQVTSNGASAKFQNQKATIPLHVPLKVGVNAITISLERNHARPEVIQLSVPVDFRVVGDMSGLAQTPEKLLLHIERTPPTEFEVNRQAVRFDSNGKGLYELDVSSELEGASPLEKVLEKRLNYIVRSATGTRQGAILLRTGIAPLVVESPGSHFVTDGSELEICGRTAANANVHISGLQTKVGADGLFCQKVAVRELGKFELWISSAAPGLAPRRVKLVVERTPNLKSYAKNLYPTVPHEIPRNQTAGASASPVEVALTGNVVERSELPHATRYLLKLENTGNRSTFVGVTSFARKAVAAGTRVTVFGEHVGSLTGPAGRSMDEIVSAFEVPAIQ